MQTIVQHIDWVPTLVFGVAVPSLFGAGMVALLRLDDRKKAMSKDWGRLSGVTVRVYNQRPVKSPGTPRDMQSNLK